MKGNEVRENTQQENNNTLRSSEQATKDTTIRENTLHGGNIKKIVKSFEQATKNNEVRENALQTDRS